MNDLIARLHFDTNAGAIHDGPRRYLMMRNDVLMGALAQLDPDLLPTVLHAFAAAAQQHGGDSIAAYAREQGLARLMDVTCSSAAALGWGAWQMEHRNAADDTAPSLHLNVDNSPFAAGLAGPMSTPVCAPITGILRSVAEQILGRAVTVTETDCAATRSDGKHHCRFEAHPAFV